MLDPWMRRAIAAALVVAFSAGEAAQAQKPQAPSPPQATGPGLLFVPDTICDHAVPVTGRVKLMLSVVIEPDGTISRFRLTQPANTKLEGDPGFQKAIKGLRFRAATLGGKPVRSQANIAVDCTNPNHSSKKHP